MTGRSAFFKAGLYRIAIDLISRQTKIFVYSKNRIFRKNPVFLKILCTKIYGTLLTVCTPSLIRRSAKIKRSGFLHSGTDWIFGNKKGRLCGCRPPFIFLYGEYSPHIVSIFMLWVYRFI